MTNEKQLIELEKKTKALQEDLESAATYIQENEVVHKRYKKGIPTVIEYQGRRYILDHTHKGGGFNDKNT
jgi:hypothetical protein